MICKDWYRALVILGVSQVTASKWTPVFEKTITDKTFSKGPVELQDFLPTILHESGSLERMKEDGWYTAKRIIELGNASLPGTRWRSLVPRAAELEKNPARFFEAVYGGRLGNGPEGTGDGARYPGRGLIQVTGKDNYRWLGDRMGQDLLVSPQLLEQPHYALESAIAWWEGKIPDTILGQTRPIRRVVNGGYYGIAMVEALAAKVAGALA